MTRIRGFASALGVAVVLWSPISRAATLSVGAGKTYSSIQAAANAAMPGDVVEVQGDETYSGTLVFSSNRGGTVDQPVTFRGILVNGRRPLLRGVGPSQYDNMVVLLNADHFVLESFEIMGDGTEGDYCIVHKANDVTLRDLVVHDCPHQGGLVGNDNGSGSLTLEYSEFFHNGGGELNHQIYMATDETAFPKSVFRMQYCYIHDGTGGNNVQSRAERNEIYYNWIEGAYYHELDLIGPDLGEPNLAREDSDVVGNVLIKTSEWRIARIGGDGSGNSSGRYRFVNNTMLLGSASKTAITLQQTVETLEMYNNVVYGSGNSLDVYEVTEQSGPDAALFGSNNWVLSGAGGIPTPWTLTKRGSDPGWVNFAAFDFRPAPTSPLVDEGTMTTAATGDLAFPSPLLLPAYSPPERRLIALGSAEPRRITGHPDIGAFEVNANPPGPPPKTNYATPASPVTAPGDGSPGCGCRVSSDVPGTGAPLASVLMAGLAVARRRIGASRCRSPASRRGSKSRPT